MKLHTAYLTLDCGFIPRSPHRIRCRQVGGYPFRSASAPGTSNHPSPGEDACIVASLPEPKSEDSQRRESGELVGHFRLSSQLITTHSQ